MRFRVTGQDGALEIEAVDWMMAMSKAITQQGLEVSGWICDNRPNGDTVVTDSGSGSTWVVRPLAERMARAPKPPLSTGAPPVPSFLGGSAGPKTLTPRPAPPRSVAAGSVPKRQPAPPKVPEPIPYKMPERPLQVDSEDEQAALAKRRAFSERARQNFARNPAPTAPHPKWAHRGQVPPPASRRPGASATPPPAPTRAAAQTPPAAPKSPPAGLNTPAVPRGKGPGGQRASEAMTLPPSAPTSDEAPSDLAERLFDVSMDISGAPDKNAACSMALEIALDLVPCEAGSVLRGAINDEALTFVAVSGPVGDKLLGVKVPFGQGLVGVAFDLGITVQVNDVAADKRHNKRIDKETGFVTRGILCVPVRTADGFYGCIQLLNPPGRFRPWHLEVAETVARTLAMTLAVR